VAIPSLGIYDIGDLVRLRATFVSTDMVTPADPSTIVFRTLSPASGVACYGFGSANASITRATVGAYYKDITPDVYGDWAYNALGTGGVQAVSEWSFQVRHSRFVL
jgi:hypothetical protein